MKKILFVFALATWALLANAQAPGCPQIDAGADQNLTCANNCVNLTANAFETGLTTDYTVSSIPYAPPFSFNGGTSVFVNNDDIWSNVITLPFSFCFYGNNYNQILIGANGVLTFDVSLAGAYCEWSYTASIPSPGPPPTGIYNNSINGAYHDIDPASLFGSADINYSVIGTTPCRTFVVNYTNVDHFNCSAGVFGGGIQTTQQIVIYETTNAIEVYINDKPVCNTWNFGNAVIGIQNANGTQGITPPGRNTGAWSASNEAWRFTPSGPSNTTVNWYDGNMNLISTGAATINVCPTSNTTYTAEAIYDRCDGTQIIEQDQVTLTVVGGFSTTTASTDEVCSGSCDGTITVTASGGTPPFSFDIGSGAQANGNFTGLCAGNYTVTVSDNGGCSGTNAFVIASGSTFNVSDVPVDETCLGDNDGSVALTASSGTAPYTYDIGLGPTNTTGAFSSLPPNTYNYTVTDATNCSVTGSFTINAGQLCCAMTLTPLFTDATCDAICDGTITVTASNGTPPYSFGLGSGAQANGNFTALCAGNYTVSVTDGSGCVETSAFVITAPTALSLSEVITDVSCGGASDGGINITVSGGTTGYSYLWSTGPITEDLSGIAGGNYDVVVTDANNCTISGTYIVNEPTAITISEVITAVSCNGNADGGIDITPSGGTTPYTFTWSTTAITEDLAGLLAGSYDVTVADANGCQETASYIVTEPTVLSVTATQVDILCNGDSTGEIDITPSGGTTPYTFLWSNAAVTEDLTSIPSGNFDVVITDANGCTVSGNYVITEPAALNLSGVAVGASCGGYADASVDITLTGGAGPYTYLWSNSAITEDLINVVADVYSVVATDANGCTITASYTAGQPSPISIVQNSLTDISCNGLTDGAIDLTITGGTAPLGFAWTNTAATTEDISNLAANTYDIVVTDVNGCTATDSYIIIEPAVLATSGTFTNVSCNGANDGTINTTTTGGTAPYNFNWTNSTATTEDLSALGANTYDLVITDASGCTASDTYIITEEAALTLTENIIDNNCFGDGLGAIDITVGGGVPGYTYSWSNSITSEDLTGLNGGSYTVVATDAVGCTISNSTAYLVNEPSEISILGDPTDISCFGSDDGSINTTVSGGTPTYSFNWASGETTANISNLTNTVFDLTVTDANGCTSTYSATINEPTAFSIAEILTNASCRLNNGSITLTPTGGTPSYNFSWSNGDDTQNISALAAGNYDITATDNNGCSVTDSYTIEDSPILVIDAGADDTISIVDSIILSPVFSDNSLIDNIIWFPDANLSCNDCPNPLVVSLETETYTLTVQDIFGCTYDDEVEIVVESNPILYVPNAFTPNGDSRNDVFLIDGNEITSGRLLIFDRWGEKVFETADYNVGWDGTYKGKSLPPDIYTYWTEVFFLNGDRTFKHGSLTLMK